MNQDHAIGAGGGITLTYALADVLQNVCHQAAANSEAVLIVAIGGALWGLVRAWLGRTAAAPAA